MENKPKEKNKKQVPLRLSASLWNDLAQWAEDDFRSINGQIEYLLTEVTGRLLFSEGGGCEVSCKL